MINEDLKIKVERVIKENNLFSKSDKLLLAVSGGIDSMVLWNILKSLEYQISIAHCNFKLRGKESDEEEEFVINTAKLQETSYHVERFNTKHYAEEFKITIQEAARNLRYNFFKKLCNDYDYKYIVTAHHLDDRIETFFINLFRGTGLKGLTAIPIKNDNIVRPLLPFTRQQIKEYALSKGIAWKEDSSNLEDKYFRNKIRHELIPIALKIKPNLYQVFLANFKRLTQEYSLLEDYINSEIEKYLEKDNSNIYIKKDILNDNRLIAVFSYYLKKNSFDDLQIKSITSKTYKVGKTYKTSNSLLIIDRDRFVISKQLSNNLNAEINIFETTSLIDFPIKLSFVTCEKTDDFNITKNSEIAYLDFNSLKFPLKLRKWKNGDYFVPFGMKGKKKISDFLTDLKVPAYLKKNVFVLTSGNDIVWVIGYRIDDRYKITDKTKKILIINLLK